MRSSQVAANKAFNITNALQISLAALFIALSGQILIPLFFTPIPLSITTLTVMLLAVLMGPKKAIVALFLRLALLPFSLFSFPLIYAGYYAGMILQAYLVGNLAKKSFFALAMISIMQLLCGSLWMGAFVGFKNIMPLGFTPFIAGELIKCLIAALVIHRYSKS